MQTYVVARLDEIDALPDGRYRYRPVRHHLGIQSFGVTAWVGAAAGDPIINEYDEDSEPAEDLIAANPQYPMLVYNLACSESLSGRTADAIDHLRRAVGASEKLRADARKDSDFDPIRDEPSFKALIGE